MKKLMLFGLYAIYVAALVAVPLAIDSQPTANAASVQVPILMYHAVVADDYAPNKYAVKKSQLVADLDYLKQKGYTTIDSYDLINYKKGAELPQKSIMLTFDDGFLSMLEVSQLLQERGFKAVLSVVGSYDGLNKEQEKCVYKYLGFQDIEQLAKSGAFEIASHTDDMHKLNGRKGASKMQGESEQEYEKAFKNDLLNLNQKLSKLGIVPVALAYPFGLSSKNSDKYLAEIGIDVSYSCAEGVNILNRNSSLYQLKRFNRSGRGADASEILRRCKLESN